MKISIIETMNIISYQLFLERDKRLITLFLLNQKLLEISKYMFKALLLVWLLRQKRNLHQYLLTLPESV